MFSEPTACLCALLFFSLQALALLEPRVLDLSTLSHSAAILPEYRNYGLFDSPAPTPAEIDHHQQKDKRAESSAPAADQAALMSTGGVATDAYSVPMSSAATMTAAAASTTDIAYPAGASVPTNFIYATITDTYILPPAYDSAQLSSLFAAESSFVSEASTLLSAFATGESGVACTGVKDVEGSEVTVCGPTGDPRATGTVSSGVGGSYVSWSFLAWGIMGGGIAFFL